MRLTKTIDEEDQEDTEISKTGNITNLEISGIEVTATQRKIYTDQTGCFPVASKKVKKYVFVLYCYDANVIISEPL